MSKDFARICLFPVNMALSVIGLFCRFNNLLLSLVRCLVLLGSFLPKVIVHQELRSFSAPNAMCYQTEVKSSNHSSGCFIHNYLQDTISNSCYDEGSDTLINLVKYLFCRPLTQINPGIPRNSGIYLCFWAVVCGLQSCSLWRVFCCFFASGVICF